MRRLLIATLALALAAAPAAVAEDPPPGSVISSNLEYLGLTPETADGTAVNFMTVGGKPLMLVTGTFALRTFDISDPGKPKLLSKFVPTGINSESDFWENEDMDVDRVRKLVFLSRDPRANGGSTDNGESGIYTVSIADPAKPVQVSYVKLPSGHTTTCINSCRWLWTGGPAKASNQPAEWGGRPIWVTDMRDPANPKVLPNPIDLGRNDGKTDYSHDVQVDKGGIAWTSGRGGVYGYRTRGLRRDPVTGKVRRATPANPILVAGGHISDDIAPSTFMHNSWRPTGRRNPIKAAGVRPGNILLATEESFNSSCANDGRFTVSDLAGSFDGQGLKSRPDKPFRLKAVGSWTPILNATEATLLPGSICSSHYFEVSGAVVGTSWYGQGFRFLDLSNAASPREIGYFRTLGGSGYAVYFRRGVVYALDNAQGVYILRFRTPPSMMSPTVVAPPLPADAPLLRILGDADGDPNALVCPRLEVVGG